MPPKQLRSARAPGHQQIAKSGTAQLSEADKKALLKRFQDLSIPVRSFVSEIFHHAKEARGRLDDDVYGVLYATLEALKDTGG
ncbi:MAG: hypothetical protein O3B73_18975, partial [bacterium]|nr:hypothetical protein [bacterium]